jgi:uncharacterized coiled-coil DUF342 family protein
MFDTNRRVWNRGVVDHSLIQQTRPVGKTGITEASRKKAAVDKDKHIELLQASGAKVDGLQAELQSIRDQEAELQAQRETKLKELKKARDERFTLMTAAIEDQVPKAQVARALGMDRTNLYKLIEAKGDSADT